MYSTAPAEDQALLTRFESHLVETGFSRILRAAHVERAEQFLKYLREVRIAPGDVTPEDLSRYLRAQLQRFRRNHGHAPKDSADWRHRQLAGVHRLLALIHGRWPPKFFATNDRDRTINRVLEEYESFLREQRKLAACTVDGYLVGAREFLDHLPGSDPESAISKLSVAIIDHYIKSRAEAGLARSTRACACNDLRSFLRFLHATGRISHEFASAVVRPSTYRHEGLPSTISPEQIRSILASAKVDHSPKGIRNYAILLLLVTYGLRAGEVCKLQLEDIDWRAGRMRVRHSKTGGQTWLPLLPDVGRAILEYLRRVRPHCKERAIFVSIKAPRLALLSTTAINSLVRRHLAAIGIRLNGKRGPHVFRHARAKSLLMAGVPLKTVGDLLGHRSASSTAVYLKLNDQQLRDIALSLPLPEATP